MLLSYAMNLSRAFDTAAAISMRTFCEGKPELFGRLVNEFSSSLNRYDNSTRDLFNTAILEANFDTNTDECKEVAQNIRTATLAKLHSIPTTNKKPQESIFTFLNTLTRIAKREELYQATVEDNQRKASNAKHRTAWSFLTNLLKQIAAQSNNEEQNYGEKPKTDISEEKPLSSFSRPRKIQNNKGGDRKEKRIYPTSGHILISEADLGDHNRYHSTDDNNSPYNPDDLRDRHISDRSPLRKFTTLDLNTHY